MILFVCTGNTCRSPMAEHLFRARAGTALGWQAVSAGVLAFPGAPASAEAVAALREKGIDLSGHRSRPVTRDLVEQADLIVAMTAGHRDELRRRFPAAADRIRLLHAFGTQAVEADVSDPIGQSMDVYRHVRDEIDSSLADLILFVREWNGRTPPPGKDGAS